MKKFLPCKPPAADRSARVRSGDTPGPCKQTQTGSRGHPLLLGLLGGLVGLRAAAGGGPAFGKQPRMSARYSRTTRLDEVAGLLTDAVAGSSARIVALKAQVEETDHGAHCIDLGGRESQVCVRDGNGGVVAEAKVPTAELGEFLKRRPSERVVLETCTEAFAVADAARQVAHEVRVVPATLVRALGVGARGVKTDVRDARLLSETSCRMEMPSVHVPSVTARELKAQLTARDTLLASRTQLINSVDSHDH